MKRDTTRWLTIGVATVTASLLFAAAAAAEGSVRPDDRATRGTGAIALETAVVRPDDRAIRPSSPSSVTFVESTAGGGFDWADAGIGAATVVGLGLVSVGVFVLVARRRHGPAFS